MTIFLFLSMVDPAIAGLNEEEKCREKGFLPCPRIQIVAKNRFYQNRVKVSSQFSVTLDRRFEFHKRRQLFIRAHNETLAVAAMCVCNPDRWPVGIHG
jgi:hypothetical protein